MDIIKTMGDFKIPQFTLLTSPEQDEIVRQREVEAEREREAGGTFISVEEMIFQYECSSDYHAKINRVSLMNFYSTTPMLVIDEIGRSMQQAREDSLLNYILRRRYENMLPTVLISNLQKTDLMKKLGDAVVDRIKETCQCVEFVGESYRPEKRKIA